MVYQTGILSVLQQSLAASLQRTLSSPAHPSLHSAVLINDLPRLNPIHPTLLLAPLQGRLDQLLSSSGPISVLQLRAQNAVRSTYALSAGSAASGYGAWLVDVLGAESGLGLAALGTAIGLRWGLGKWEKAKRKFWVDFARVESGLEEDLQVRSIFVCSSHLVERQNPLTSCFVPLAHDPSLAPSEKHSSSSVGRATFPAQESGRRDGGDGRQAPGRTRDNGRRGRASAEGAGGSEVQGGRNLGMRCRSPSPNGPWIADDRFSYSVSTRCRQSDWGRSAEVERASWPTLRPTD